MASDTGSIYVHVGTTVSHAIKLILADVFGAEHFRNEVIWQRHGSHNDPNKYGTIHDSILFFSRGSTWTFNPVYMPYDEEYIEERFRYTDKTTGRRFWANTLTAAGTGPARRIGGKVLSPPAGRHWAFDQEGIDKLQAEDRIYFSETGFPYLKQYLDESPGKPSPRPLARSERSCAFLRRVEWRK